jgi:hypothetical protein
VCRCSSPGPRAVTAVLALAVSFLGPIPPVFALATEHHGNDPVPPGFVDLGPEALALANLKTRFYWFEVNGDPTFYYQGQSDALNEALQKFAALPGDAREVVLLPGAGEGSSLTGDKHFAYDWRVHTPAGLTLGGPPTMTVHVGAVAPAMPPDAKQLARWIADLDSDDFTTRDRASKELQKLGPAAAPALRKALAAKPTAETLNRIEHLLGLLGGIDLREVKLPAGVTVLEVKDLLERYRRGLKSEDGSARGHAASGLSGLARYADVVPDLVEVLKADRHEYARRCAAGGLSRLGKKAAPALPVLKAGLNDPDVNIRNAFAHAVQQIEAAGEEKTGEEQARRQQALLEGISTFRKSLPAAPKK